ncbi:MAG TPA: lysine transporter LysE [Armatimonadetes bacterium]|nr:lysine transporter LysE [Armatimonadota bacterium]
MALIQLAFNSFLIGFSGAIMPGPVLAATIPAAVREGFVAGPLIVLGHGLVEVALVLLVVSSLGVALRREDSPLVRGIALVGGLMLLLMGGMMLRDLPHLSLTLTAQGQRGLALPPVLAGALCSLSNPYFFLWWATIGLGLITQALSGWGRLGVLIFYGSHVLSDLVWYSFVSGTIAVGKRALSDSLYRGLIGVCAVALLLFGLRFFSAGVRGQLPGRKN